MSLTPIPKTRLAVLISNIVRASVAPAVTSAPVINQTQVGSPVTFTPGTASGSPTPSIRNDLYRNGSVYVQGYASGSYIATVASDTFYVVDVFANQVGIVTSQSNTVTTLAAPAGAPVFTNQATMPVAPIGWLYYFPFNAANSPTSWALASGITLPTGWTFDTTTGLLQATPQVTPTPGVYPIQIIATNGSGSTTSQVYSLTVSYNVEITGVPVTGSPSRFVVLNYYYPEIGQNGALGVVQWYRNLNDGNGPQAIAGATGLTYTPVDPTDTGYFHSVDVVIGGVHYRSGEFKTAPGVYPQQGEPTEVFVSAAVVARGLAAWRINSGITLTAPQLARYIAGTAYTEQTLAPGAYAGYSASFGNYGLLNPYGGNPNLNVINRRVGVPAAIKQQTSLPPSTATRPAGNTGTGFYCANGTAYDANNNEFFGLGFNRCHYDDDSFGQYNANPNLIRIFLLPSEGWTNTIYARATKPVLTGIIANHVAVMPTYAGAQAFPTATISGSVLTVGSMLFGNMFWQTQPAAPGLWFALQYQAVTTVNGQNHFAINSPSWFLPPTVIIGGTGTGKAGTYFLRHPSTSESSLTSACALGTGSAVQSDCQFTGTVDVNNVLTVTAINGANTSSITAGRNVWITFQFSNSIPSNLRGTTRTCAVIATIGSGGTTGTGGTGTYQLTLAINQATPSAFGIDGGTSSGSPEPSIALSLANTFADQFANYASIQDQMFLNIANEWGPQTAGVWFNTCKSIITVIRGAGYTCPIVLDAPGSGQDSGTGVTIFATGAGAAELVAFDSFGSVIVSQHLYGAGPLALAGGLAALATATYNYTQGTGAMIMWGEVGPYYPTTNAPSPTVMDPRESLGQSLSKHIPVLFWAWDDPASSSAGDQSEFMMVFQAGSPLGSGGFQSTSSFPTGDPSQLTWFGQQVVLEPHIGLRARAVKNTVF